MGYSIFKMFCAKRICSFHILCKLIVLHLHISLSNKCLYCYTGELVTDRLSASPTGLSSDALFSYFSN